MTTAGEQAAQSGEPVLRHPTVRDGAGVWRLVRRSGVLDLNSSYAYLLFCQRFADTCVVAEYGGEIVGFVLGFIPPGSPNVVFVWQIGVDGSMRGRGLGGKILRELIASPACRDVTHMETTITPSNEASQKLFRSFARSVEAPVNVSEEDGFPEDVFPDGKEAEHLYRIGPFEKTNARGGNQ